MFGKGADAMRRFDETMEEVWMNEIISTQIETALGPMNSGISAFELWSRVMDVKRIRSLGAMFDEAMRSVAADSMEARRIAFFRRQMLEPMAKRALEFDCEGGVERELAARQARGAVSVVKDFKPVEFDIVSTNRDVHTKAIPVRLKGGARYRVSYVLSGDNLGQFGAPDQMRVRKMWGGALGMVKIGGKTPVCIGRGIRGTFNPVVQAFEFSVPGEKGKEIAGEVHFTMFWTTGRAKYDRLMVEELEGGK
jgi:hypothetical protein